LRIFVVSLPAMLVLMIVQLFVRSLPSAPNFIREYPMAVIGLYLGTETLLIVYALRHLFKMENLTGIVVSSQFVQKYGISPREREIVSMMALGYNNRKIGENLFISTMTVKNHIYHIYQKTGAQNKIQLFNLVKPQK
jgi:DNA-binding CsgD family transcriptional regulator